MQLLVVSNNPLVYERFSGNLPVDYRELDFLELLRHVRDRVHRGEKLLTHPLSGSVKPSETPYKSILLDVEAGEETDAFSLRLIEEAILLSARMIAEASRGLKSVTERQRSDFQLIDLTLIESALPSTGWARRH